MGFCVSLGSSVTLPLKLELEPLGVVKTGCLCLGPTSLISFCGCATLLTACGGSSESGLCLRGYGKDGRGSKCSDKTESVSPKVEIVTACLEYEGPAFQTFLQVSVGNGADLWL